MSNCSLKCLPLLLGPEYERLEIGFLCSPGPAQCQVLGCEASVCGTELN